MAGWQSGHAADCNSVYAGSIPTPASKVIQQRPKAYFCKMLCPSGEIGRHKGFKIPRSYECAGSSPASGTIIIFGINYLWYDQI